MPDQPKTPQRPVRVSDELWSAAKAKAAEQGTTVSAVIRAALREFANVKAARDEG